MKIESGVVAFMAIMMTIVVCIYSPVMATEQTERYWVKMNPDQFPSTSESAAEQCRRAASLLGSRVTAENCTTLKSMLDAEKCVVEAVGDGIRFDLMSTYEKGRQTVVGPMMKKLGRTDQAMVCNLGDEITTYFFIGDPRVSCGNLAFVVEAPEVVEVPLVTELPEIRLVPLPQKCRWVEIERKVNSIPGQLFATQPTILVGCHGGGILVGGNVYQTPSTSTVSSNYKKVCD